MQSSGSIAGIDIQASTTLSAPLFESNHFSSLSNPSPSITKQENLDNLGSSPHNESPLAPKTELASDKNGMAKKRGRSPEKDKSSENSCNDAPSPFPSAPLATQHVPKSISSLSTSPSSLSTTPGTIRIKLPRTGEHANSSGGRGSTRPVSSPQSISSSGVERTSPVSQPGSSSRAEKWGKLLLPHFMAEAAEEERPSIVQLCERIASAVPGDKMEARDTFMMLLANIKDPLNTDLRKRLVDGVLPVEVLVTLGEKDLANPETKRELEEGFNERSKDTNLNAIADALKTTSTLFVCPNCKARDCSWVQRQTRSGDEPMTVICSCNKCDYQWRKY